MKGDPDILDDVDLEVFVRGDSIIYLSSLIGSRRLVITVMAEAISRAIFKPSYLRGYSDAAGTLAPSGLSFPGRGAGARSLFPTAIPADSSGTPAPEGGSNGVDRMHILP